MYFGSLFLLPLKSSTFGAWYSHLIKKRKVTGSKFWQRITRFILRYRVVNLILIALMTLFMGYKALDVQMSYEFAQMLPDTDTVNIEYQKFKNTFGSDGAVIFLGVDDDNIYHLDEFNMWAQLCEDIRTTDGVEEVVSLSRMYNLTRNDSLKRFDFHPVFNSSLPNQSSLDSLVSFAYSLPIYDGILYNGETNATFMAVTLDASQINSPSRTVTVEKIEKLVKSFEKDSGIDTALSGMPFIRTSTTEIIKSDLFLFMLLAALVASIALFLFFRSFRAVIFPMGIVIISVIFGLGIISIMGFKITILNGIIPPLMIIIGVENCIFLLNKYHQEYKSHGNKMLALSRMVQRVGNATLMTNITTAIGFAAFIITGNRILVEFGIVASLNILVVFVLSIFLIPIFYSYVKEPTVKDLKHLENKATYGLLANLTRLVLNYRNQIYIVSAVILVIGIWGITRLQTTASVVDDIPHKSEMYQDLLFFEDQIEGLLPFEITIDTKKPRGVLKLSTLKRLEKVHNIIDEYPELSKAYSAVTMAKVAKQTYYNGKKEYYELPNNQEVNFIMKYLPDQDGGDISILNNLIDSDLRTARIMVQIKNVGSPDIQRIKEDLSQRIAEIFPAEKYDVTITGTSVVYQRSTDYLISNLKTSLLIAVLAITILMIFLFRSFKMVSVSLIPNLFPLLLTAALMGFVGVAIKPSTIIIFSIALGISVDNTIHYLSRYRLALKYYEGNISKAVISALNEMGFSIIYSSIVLFFGFGIFIFSSFGGTQALGFLVSFTLLIAVLSNLLVLPSLLLTLNKWITTKSFRKEPFMEIYDEEEDIDVDRMPIERESLN